MMHTNMNTNIVLAAVAACVASLATGAAHAEIPDEVVVGGIFDITGSWAAEGEASKNAAVQAVADFNDYLDGIGADWRMTMKVEDAQAQGSVAFDKLTALRGTGVNLMLGMGFSSHILLAASYIEQNDILVISHASQALTLDTDDSVFRLVPNDGNQALAIDAMLDDANIEVLVLVTRADAWGDGLRNSMTEMFNGTVVEGIRYDVPAKDLSASVSVLDEEVGELIDQHGADKIGVLFVGVDEFLLMIEQMAFYENVKNVRWFGSNTQGQNAELLQNESALEFVEATMFTATRQQLGATNHITTHVDTFMDDTYGFDPTSYTYAAYDSVWLLGNAILQTGTTDADTLTTAIPLVSQHMLGAAGQLLLTENGDLVPASYDIRQIQDGGWVDIAIYDPATRSIVR